ncbi:hypothetical protein R6M67_48250, partial [Streptomyces sp. Wh19]|nr:hypothetical protein [Streptomyces sp. Wh19]
MTPLVTFAVLVAAVTHASWNAATGGPVLHTSPASFAAFVAGVKAGEFGAVRPGPTPHRPTPPRRATHGGAVGRPEAGTSGPAALSPPGPAPGGPAFPR